MIVIPVYEEKLTAPAEVVSFILILFKSFSQLVHGMNVAVKTFT